MSAQSGNLRQGEIVETSGGMADSGCGCEAGATRSNLTEEMVCVTAERFLTGTEVDAPSILNPCRRHCKMDVTVLFGFNGRSAEADGQMKKR